MPRKARIDAHGALHHIMARGIEGRPIFQNDYDRKDFINRLAPIVEETETKCYAWALIPNHFHLLLKTGIIPIAKVMLRLLTGYAVSYNLRHKRQGHLFQNRYKSILCQEDPYLLELVRYIHLNPIRANLVPDLKSLETYLFCGHGTLMGKLKNEWQEVKNVLRLFGKNISQARRSYKSFIEKGVAQGRRDDLTGGGLVRSVGGWVLGTSVTFGHLRQKVYRRDTAPSGTVGGHHPHPHSLPLPVGFLFRSNHCYLLKKTGAFSSSKNLKITGK